MNNKNSTPRLQSLLDELDVAVIIIGQNDKILYVNNKVKQDIGEGFADICGSSYRDLFWGSFIVLFDALKKKCADGASHTDVYFWQEHSIWEQVSCRLVDWDDGSQVFLLSITNITEVSRSEYEYRKLAYFDRQLELPNGKKLEVDIAAVESFRHAALIHFDINNFSSIIDLFGWDAGDYLLEQVRDWLKGTLRKTSALYRISEDEFCLLIRQISLEDARKRAAEIARRFTKPWKLPPQSSGIPLYCTIKIGMVYGSYVNDEMRNVFYRTINFSSDENIGYTIYDEELDSKIRDRLWLRQSLLNCVQQDMKGFSVHYQPIVDAKTGRWSGAEALCRWQSPKGESIPPLTFIPEAEKLGLINKIDAWVRETAMRQCIDWGLDKKNFFLDMNLSPVINITDHFIDGFLKTVESIGFPKHKINLEITESHKVNFSESNMNGFLRLKEEGVIVSLDDFGTGYSSFDSLVKIPAHALKTERAFIIGLEENDYLQYLLQVMVNIAHRVEMALVCEGVETAAQKELLQSYGVDYMQGYYFGRPLPASQFSQYLGNYSAENCGCK